MNKSWPNRDNSLLFEDLWFIETPPLWMGEWVDQWVGSGQMTNLIKLKLINIIWFCLKIYDLWRHSHLWMDGWAHVKSLKSNKSWPNWDNSIMDILDFFWTFYLNHLSPLWGYFYLCTSYFVLLLWPNSTLVNILSLIVHYH